MDPFIDFSLFKSFQLGHLGLILFFIQLPVLVMLWNRYRHLQRYISEVKNELHALLECERNMGARLKTQQQRMHGIVERQDKIEINELSQTSYKQAIALMHKGASPDEMVEVCDISRGELDLIARLQKKRLKKQQPNIA